MDNPYVLPLSLLVFLPTIGAFLLLFVRRELNALAYLDRALNPSAAPSYGVAGDP